eukprot:TRINITY_DN93_c0_g1_i1.p2 TRINITY_DN93_c0_g1~~TRINITY_DN93_c0_g1_i1.p2  ORF type:complete len:225 (-),score=66.09 TRINITY_DN93_c0_g1_i1:1272-1946(-)
MNKLTFLAVVFVFVIIGFVNAQSSSELYQACINDVRKFCPKNEYINWSPEYLFNYPCIKDNVNSLSSTCSMEYNEYTNGNDNYYYPIDPLPPISKPYYYVEDDNVWNPIIVSEPPQEDFTTFESFNDNNNNNNNDWTTIIFTRTSSSSYSEMAWYYILLIVLGSLIAGCSLVVFFVFVAKVVVRHRRNKGDYNYSALDTSFGDDSIPYIVQDENGQQFIPVIID